MQTSTYLKIDNDALIEWVYDDDNNISSNYNVVTDEINSTTTFYLSSDYINKKGTGLYATNAVQQKYATADPETVSFINPTEYITPPLAKYDKLKLYLPIGFVFSNVVGFSLRVKALSYDMTEYFELTNYYYESTQQDRISELTAVNPPLRIQDRFWGQNVEINLPSVYTESRNRIGQQPVPGTINYNLTGGISGNGLSQTAPIVIEFAWITDKKTVLNQTVYTLSKYTTSTVPQAPTYKNLGVNISTALAGDYFTINGTYNGTSAEFGTFMSDLETLGQKSYAIFTVEQYEENIPTLAQDFYVYKDFAKPLFFRPVFLLSSTTSSIKVVMKIVNAIDGSVLIREAEYGMLPNETLKYGSKLLSINISNATKPKIWNAKPDQVVVPEVVLKNTTRRVNTQIQKNTVIKPIPVLSNSANIILKNTADANSSYLPIGQLELLLHPYDNIIKLRVANSIVDSEPVPYEFPTNNATALLTFKSTKGDVEIPVLSTSKELDLTKGVLVFNIKESDINSIKQRVVIENANFYIVLRTELATTVLYTGKFILSDSDEYRSRSTTTTSSTTTTTRTNNVNTATNNSNVVNTTNFNPNTVFTFDNNDNAILVTQAGNTLVEAGNGIVATGQLGDLQLAGYQFRLVL
jgi:hypothetical protein